MTSKDTDTLDIAATISSGGVPTKQAGDRPSEEAQDAENNADAVSSHEVSLRRISINGGRKGWKRAAARVKELKNVTQAVGKVPISNKIGKSAADLNDDDPLKAISLAAQRALKSFGSAGAKSSEGLRSVEFAEAEAAQQQVAGGNGGGEIVGVEVSDANNIECATFSARQPAFKCFEMFHDVFQDIRSAFGITETQFYAVLGLQDMATISSFAVIGSGDASGKSPSFFFLSPDQRFILKSCTKRDVKTLSRILPTYRDHVKSCIPDDGDGNSSLLPRYIGLYKMLFQDDTPDVTLVVMTNFFAGTYAIHKKFDLKGSTYHREASEKELTKSSPVLKDLDWMKEGRKLKFPTKEEVESIRQRLEKDTLYLCKEKLIDYSLLIGVHEIGKDEDVGKTRSETMDVISAISSTEVQYFGIVDILTPFVAQKRAETICTGTLLCRPGISCQPPKKYQSRFMSFVCEEILACG